MTDEILPAIVDDDCGQRRRTQGVVAGAALADPPPPAGACQHCGLGVARLPNAGNRSRYDYVAPSFDFRAVLVYDEFGLVLEYPGIAVRTA
jgi:hypothetical protein